MEIVLTPPHTHLALSFAPHPCTQCDFSAVFLYGKRQKIKPKSLCSSENSHTPLLEDAVTQMTPEEHYRRMMSALNEHGTFEEQQQQRLYQLANSMAVPSHGGTGTGGHQGLGLPMVTACKMFW